MDSAKLLNHYCVKYYYFNDGYFDVTTSATIDTVQPKRAIKYLVNRKSCLLLDTIKNDFYTALDSYMIQKIGLYNQENNIKRSILKKNEIV
jgi:hypothetical protein